MRAGSTITPELDEAADPLVGLVDACAHWIGFRLCFRFRRAQRRAAPALGKTVVVVDAADDDAPCERPITNPIPTPASTTAIATTTAPALRNAA